MSIAPGVPLHLFKAPQSDSTSSTTPSNDPSLRPLNASNRNSISPTSAPAAHIAASPAALSTHLQSTAAVLSDLDASRFTSVATDVEDLVLLDGSLRRRPPVVPAYCPYRVQLQADRTYRWCACGRSKKQPWCDGSHSETDPQPVLLRLSAQQQQSLHYLCGCKYTSTPPLCDGSHIHAVIGAEEQRARQTAMAAAASTD